MPRTYTEIFTFTNVAVSYLKRHEKDQDESKLRYALKKLVKAGQKVFEDYQEQVEDLRIEHCSEDERGNIQRDAQQNYTFTKDKLRQLTKAIRVLAEKSVEFKPYLVEVAPVDLTDAERDAFAGFVLAERADEEPALRLVDKE